jgi:hypothetical protein
MMTLEAIYYFIVGKKSNTTKAQVHTFSPISFGISKLLFNFALENNKDIIWKRQRNPLSSY